VGRAANVYHVAAGPPPVFPTGCLLVIPSSCVAVARCASPTDESKDSMQHTIMRIGMTCRTERDG
jgi:hypothetical protein